MMKTILPPRGGPPTDENRRRRRQQPRAAASAIIRGRWSMPFAVVSAIAMVLSTAVLPPAASAPLFDKNPTAANQGMMATTSTLEQQQQQQQQPQQPSDGDNETASTAPTCLSQKIIIRNGVPVSLTDFPYFVEQGYTISVIDSKRQIYYVHSFLSGTEASTMSTFGAGRFNRSPQTGVSDLTGQANAARTSTSCPLLFAYFYMPRYEDVKAKSPALAEELRLTWDVTVRAARLLGVDEAQFEPFQLLRYSPGEFYKQHHDHRGYYDPVSGYPDRPITMLLFLNDVEKGGDLRFERLGIDFRPSKGDAIVWSNVDSEGRADHDLVHEAMPVLEGSKMAVNVWIRDKPFTDMRQASMRQH